MTPRQLKRLHNIVRVLRDAAKNARLRRLFTMGQFGYHEDDGPNLCGTPACALGHYAVRRDLQRTFVLDRNELIVGEECAGYANHVSRHFGITAQQAHELFDGEGCKGATTPTQAANYIARFIKRITANETCT